MGFDSKYPIRTSFNYISGTSYSLLPTTVFHLGSTVNGAATTKAEQKLYWTEVSS